MAIAWSCSCGMTFSTAPESGGQRILCPSCGAMNELPASGSPVQVKEPLPLPVRLPPRVRAEEVLEVIPVEDEIPELDVEEDEEPASFADKLAAAGNHTWSTIGMIPLSQLASCVAFGPGGAWGLATQEDEILTINMHKGKKLDRFGDHGGLVTTLSISKAGDFSISGDDEGDVLYWDIPSCKRLRRMRIHETAITASAIATNLSHAATGDRRGLVLRWGLPKGFEERLVDSEFSERIIALTFSADSAFLAAGGSKGRVQVWSVKRGDSVHRFRVPNASIAGLEFSSKNETLLAVLKPEQATVPTHPRVFRFDLNSGQSQECFQPADAARIFPHCARLAPGGKRLLCAGKAREGGRNVLEVWSLTSAQPLHVYQNLTAAVEDLAVTPENTRLVLTNARRQLQVFSMPERDTPGDRLASRAASPETRIIGPS